MIENVIIVIWLHWFADFVLQTDAMAKGKSKTYRWLALHVLVYMLPLLFFGYKFAVINGVLHWITDFFSSRMTSKLWAKGDVHNFFVVIGIDQAIHMTCLILTLKYFGYV